MKSLNEHSEFIKESKEENLKLINDKFKTEFDEITKHFYKHFPNGSMYIGFQQIVGAPHLNIVFRLIGSLDDMPHRITRNDPWNAGFVGHFKSGYSDYNYKPSESDLIELESRSVGYYIKPEEGSYYAMSRVKMPFRKKTATMDKLVKPLKDYITKVAVSMIENKDNFMKDVNIEKYVNTIKK